MKTVDLHTHTTFSDGTESPRDLVLHAKQIGLSAIAITDHDTLAGLSEAEDVAAEENLYLIRGCELSTRTEYGELHILGLWVPRGDSSLSAALAELSAKRTERNQNIVGRLQELGIGVTYDLVRSFAGQGSVGRPHIAKALMAVGCVKSRREAFDRFIGKGCPAFVPKFVFSPETACDILSRAGATVSLAHPFLHGYPKEWLYERVKNLVEHGLDCLEAWHTEHSLSDTKLCLEWAEKLGLGVTGGSDYHGGNKPGVHLGKGRNTLCLSWDIVERLQERRRAKGLPVPH